MKESVQERLLKMKSELPIEVSSSFLSADTLNDETGWPTGCHDLDQFLAWRGLPKEALSLFLGKPGFGGTSFWIEPAHEILQKRKWVAWISAEAQLFPLPLRQKDMCLERLLVAEKPETSEKLLWLLQELMSSSLFELIGCDLGTPGHQEKGLKEHQLRKLQTAARALKTSVVFFSDNERMRRSSVYALILHFSKAGISVERALHRPTPHLIKRSLTYARFTQQSHSLLGSASARIKSET